MNKIDNSNEPIIKIKINKGATDFIIYECLNCKQKLFIENGVDRSTCPKCGFMINPIRKATRADMYESTMKASGIKVNVEVDTDDLDIAIGKAKELNRELKKAKELMSELATMLYR